MAMADLSDDTLLDVQLDLARSHDEHEGTMDLLRATLDAITELLRARRNSGARRCVSALVRRLLTAEQRRRTQRRTDAGP